MSMFVPEDFAKRPGRADLETELRSWLRSIPLTERIDFIRRLWPLNYRFALSLVRSSQLPTVEVVSLLEHWLSLGQHNTAEGLIEGLMPVVGESRFWRTAAQGDLTQAMEELLNYYGHGQLAKYKSEKAENC
jgi:hypothetical protein